MTYNLNYDEIHKSELEKVAQQRADKKTSINTVYDSQKTVTTDEYNRDIANTERSYADMYQKNAVQKLINERQIAENMENLGLTDSGLNRTQQTAAQLSYANQKGKLDIAKQQSLDEKSSALAAAIATIEQNRISALDQNETYWDSVADNNAQAIYKTNYDAYTAEQKALLEAQQKELDRIADYNLAIEKAKIAAGTANSNGVVLQKWYGETNDFGLLKFVGSDGKTKYVTPGKNPYTNKQNAKVTVENGKCIIDKDWQSKNKNSSDAIVRACANYGVFSNGYQPKGVCYYSDNGTLVDAGSLTATTRKDEMNGNMQTVWYAKKTNTYWIWNGSTNEYEQYEM